MAAAGEAVKKKRKSPAKSSPTKKRTRKATPDTATSDPTVTATATAAATAAAAAVDSSPTKKSKGKRAAAAASADSTVDASTGLTGAERELLYRAQNESCPICDEPLVSSNHASSVVDTDPRFTTPESVRTGVRGLIHASCNSLLAAFTRHALTDGGVYRPTILVHKLSRIMKHVIAPPAHAALSTGADTLPVTLAAHGKGARNAAKVVSDAKSATESVELTLAAVKAYESHITGAFHSLAPASPAKKPATGLAAAAAPLSLGSPASASASASSSSASSSSSSSSSSAASSATAVSSV